MTKYHPVDFFNDTQGQNKKQSVFFVLKMRWRKKQITQSRVLSSLKEKVLFQNEKLKKVAQELSINYFTAKTIIYQTRKLIKSQKTQRVCSIKQCKQNENLTSVKIITINDDSPKQKTLFNKIINLTYPVNCTLPCVEKFSSNQSTKTTQSIKND